MYNTKWIVWGLYKKLQAGQNCMFCNKYFARSFSCHKQLYSLVEVIAKIYNVLCAINQTRICYCIHSAVKRWIVEVQMEAMESNLCNPTELWKLIMLPFGALIQQHKTKINLCYLFVFNYCFCINIFLYILPNSNYIRNNKLWWTSYLLKYNKFTDANL